MVIHWMVGTPSRRPVDFASIPALHRQYRHDDPVAAWIEPTTRAPIGARLAPVPGVPLALECGVKSKIVLGPPYWQTTRTRRRVADADRRTRMRALVECAGESDVALQSR